jgi:SAM-dependent methyltransferase
MRPRELYDELFFDSFDDVAQASAEAVVPLVLERVPATSVIDVGCGRGYWLRAFKQAGVERVFGVDGGKINADRLVISPSEFASVDLSGVVQGNPLNVSTYDGFDLATCMEVAEHLPPAAAGAFVRALTELAPALLFSAAIPRQGGTGHINEQWPSDWARLFADAGDIRAVSCMHDDLNLSEVGRCGRSDHRHHSMMATTGQQINKARVP